MRSIDGLTYDQVLDILEGRSKLVGNSDDGLTIEADTASGKTLKDIFKQLKRERDDAVDYGADLVEVMNEDTVIVASATGARRVPRRKTKRNAAGRSVLKEDYEWSDTDPLVRNPNAVEPKVWQEVDYDLRRERNTPCPSGMGSADRSEKIILEAMDEPPVARDLPQSFDKITSSTGWLTPDGKFYPCRYGEHAWLADALGFHQDDRSRVRCAHHMGEQWFFCDDDLITQKQKDLIAEFCITKKIKLPWWMQDK